MATLGATSSTATFFDYVAPSTSGNVLTSNGTIWTSAAPAGGGIPKSYLDPGAANLTSNVTRATEFDMVSLKIADGVVGNFSINTIVPTGATSISSCVMLFRQRNANTNLYLRWYWQRARGGVSMQYDQTDTYTATSSTATGASDVASISAPAGSFNGLTLQAGDIIGLNFYRDGSDAADTYGNELNILGFIITYA